MKWPTTMSTVLLPSSKKSTGPPSSKSSERSIPSKASSSTKSKKPNKNVKLVVIAGIALPLVAAVIGVVAWAISADSIHRSPMKNLHHPEKYLSSENERYIDVLESRNDLDHSSNHIFNSYSRAEPISGERERLMGKDAEKEDPLYVVHFVSSPPTDDTGDDAIQNVSPLTKISSATDPESKKLLEKIMATSKKDNPGVPQFVVFASLPESEDSKQQNNSTQTKQVWSSSTKNNQEQFDYEYDYVGVGDHSKGKKIEPGEGAARSGSAPETVQSLQQPYLSEMLQNQMKQQSSVPNSASIPRQSYGQDTSLRYPPPQDTSLRYPALKDTSLKYPPQAPLPPPPPPPPPPQQQNYAQPNSQPSTLYGQQGEPERSGIELPPLGLKLSLGSGGHGGGLKVSLGGGDHGHGYGGGGGNPLGLKFSLGGGDHGHGHSHGYGHGGGLSFSPLGIMATILKPLLPRPKAHVNGKMMFGVMLENGLKFGERKHHLAHYP